MDINNVKNNAMVQKLSFIAEGKSQEELAEEIHDIRKQINVLMPSSVSWYITREEEFYLLEFVKGTPNLKTLTPLCSKYNVKIKSKTFNLKDEDEDDLELLKHIAFSKLHDSSMILYGILNKDNIHLLETFGVQNLNELIIFSFTTDNNATLSMKNINYLMSYASTHNITSIRFGQHHFTDLSDMNPPRSLDFAIIPINNSNMTSTATLGKFNKIQDRYNKTKDKNTFIDELIDAGYEDWL